jgi:hypothetical protein
MTELVCIGGLSKPNGETYYLFGEEFLIKEKKNEMIQYLCSIIFKLEAGKIYRSEYFGTYFLLKEWR